MGPTECRKMSNNRLQGATSVFTTLYQYANLINSTMVETENSLRQQKPRTVVDPLGDPVKAKCTSPVLHYILFRLFILLLYSL